VTTNWEPGRSYWYRKRVDRSDPMPHIERWRAARCIQDKHTGVISVVLRGSRAKLNVNRPSWFEPYEWAGPIEKGVEPADSLPFVPPGVVATP